MFRSLMYGSYRNPRELLWIIGVMIYLLLMAEAFMGYLLPWGQMSFWGAQVIINLFSSIPVIGPDLAIMIRGDFVVSDITLNRFFALHVIAIPLLLVLIVAAHLIALHHVGSNNPDGIDIKKHKDANGHPLDAVPFHPYYTTKDSVGVVAFLIIFCSIIFFAPDMGGYFLEYNNFVPANPMKTPVLKDYEPKKKKVFHLNPNYILALFRSIFKLGFIGEERIYYWKLFFWSLFRKPQLFSLAILFTIYGFHFKKISSSYS